MLFGAGILSAFVFPVPTIFADTTFSNTNLLSTPHPKPMLVSEEDTKNDTISLVGGKEFRVFRQSISGVPLWRFELDGAYWWVSPRGVIWGKGTHPADSPEAAFEAKTDSEAYQVFLGMKAATASVFDRHT